MLYYTVVLYDSSHKNVLEAEELNMRQKIIAVILISFLILTSCGRAPETLSEIHTEPQQNQSSLYRQPETDAQPHETPESSSSLSPSPLPDTTNPLEQQTIQKISPLGQQAAFEFLSGFPTLFQNLGFHDKNTEEFYALVAGEWINIANLPPTEIPMVFQGGVRDGMPEGSYTDTWGIFFGSDFYNKNGNLIANAPFIHEAQDGGALAYDFQLLNINDDGVPEILIRFVTRGTTTLLDGRAWGFQSFGPFVLYQLPLVEHGAIREIILPGQPLHHYYATFPHIYINDLGEKIIFIHTEGHITERAYSLNFANQGNELEQILSDEMDDALHWWNENHQFLTEFLPLTDLQNDFYEKMRTLESWQIAYANLLLDYATQKLGDEYDDRLGGMFLLHDIDRRGIPQLIVANSFHFTHYLVGYSYENGELIRLDIEHFYDYSARVLAPIGNAPGLIQMFGEAWIDISAFLVLDGNRLTVENSVTFLGGWGTDDGEDAWFVNDVEVTHEEYNRAFAEIFGFERDSDWWFEQKIIQHHHIDESSISRVIFRYCYP